jgi:hypothetical protein
MNWQKYRSETESQKRSDKASRAANARWDTYHDENPRTYPPELPEDCIRITVDNLVTGKSHVMVFHPGSRAGRFRVDVDGQFWKECGFSDALARIRKSCKRTPLYVYD